MSAGLEFATEPTTPAPDPNKPYLWIGGQWVLLAMDTTDGVPESLDDLGEDEGSRLFIWADQRHLSGQHDQKKHGGGAPRITAAEARGNSRAVSPEEYDALSAEGKRTLDKMRQDRAPITGLDDNWASVKANAYREVQKSWGGATINSHTGVPLSSTANRFALSVKPAGLKTISVPETATRQQFDAAMDNAKQQFRPQLEVQRAHLGVFHDDDNNRIDMDPVVVVDTPHEVETIGAYTHAIGGAYHFQSGDGYFPPHVGDAERSIALGDSVHWKGPGQWRSYAESVQPGFDDGRSATTGEHRDLMSIVERKVVLVGSYCKQCAANKDPAKVPVHPRCNCEVVTENITLGTDPEHIRALEDWIVRTLESSDHVTLVPGSVSVLPRDDLRFGDLAKWFELAGGMFAMGDLITVITDEGEFADTLDAMGTATVWIGLANLAGGA
jgi:hypothetical protein